MLIQISIYQKEPLEEKTNALYLNSIGLEHILWRKTQKYGFEDVMYMASKSPYLLF